jgi:hypothetical protein
VRAKVSFATRTVSCPIVLFSGAASQSCTILSKAAKFYDHTISQVVAVHIFALAYLYLEIPLDSSTTLFQRTHNTHAPYQHLAVPLVKAYLEILSLRHKTPASLVIHPDRSPCRSTCSTSPGSCLPRSVDMSSSSSPSTWLPKARLMMAMNSSNVSTIGSRLLKTGTFCPCIPTMATVATSRSKTSLSVSNLICHQARTDPTTTLESAGRSQRPYAYRMMSRLYGTSYDPSTTVDLISSTHSFAPTTQPYSAATHSLTAPFASVLT